jgi:hypothetical protein
MDLTGIIVIVVVVVADVAVELEGAGMMEE